MHVAIAEKYARDVVSGKIPNCKWVKLACGHHLADRQNKSLPYKFNKDEANRVCSFIETLPHVKGKWAQRREKFILQPWQCFIVCSIFGWLRPDGTRRYREAYLKIPRKNGKALALGTLIPTPCGFKKMLDVHPGDWVFGFDGKLVKVLAESPVFLGHECYEVEFSSGEKIICDAGHLWKTTAHVNEPGNRKRKGFKHGETVATRVRTTEELAKTVRYGTRKDRNHSILVASAIELPDIDVIIDPYVLGVWLGDGTSLSSCFTSPDAEVIAEVERLEGEIKFVEQRGLAATYRIGRSYWEGTPAVDTFQGRLRRLGVLGNKHIPAEYLRASFAQRLSLLQGLMDTDGTASKAGKLDYVSTRIELAKGVYELVASLGLKPSFSSRDAKLYGRVVGTAYQISFFADRSFPVFRLQRKLERQVTRKLTRSKTRQIVSVTPIASVPTKCISVAAEDQLFLVGETFIPTHNSMLAAAIGMYTWLADGEYGAEVYAGATCERQAWEVFGPAKRMLQQSPDLREAVETEVWAKRLLVPSDGSRMEPIVGKPGDGSSPSCAIVDEFHEHDTPDLVDTMKTGMGARSQPLLLMVTTAGFNTGGPCYDVEMEARKCLEGTSTNEHLFACMWELDDNDEWTDPKILAKANPNFGVSVDEEFLRHEQRQAVINPANANRFKTKHLNMWTSARTAWMSIPAWDASVDPDLHLDEFLGQECVLSLDLASKIDICARVKVFRRKGHYYSFENYYLPEDTVESDKKNAYIYRKWRDQGLLTVHDGAEVNYDRLREDVLADASRYQIREVVYDPWRATQLAHQLMSDGAIVVEYRQTVQLMSPAMKEVMAAVVSGRYHHTGNPITRWMMSNVTAKVDAKENVFPRKEKPEFKIDGPIAIMMAVGRLMTEVDPVEPSIRWA